MEDVKQTAAVEEKKVNVTESDTDGLNYTHVFKNPFEFEGKTYDKLTFNFEGLLGSDMIAVENEMAAVGEYVLSPKSQPLSCQRQREQQA